MNGIIAGFVSDIMFQTRIESAAERLGAKVKWVDGVDQGTDINVDTPLFTESVMLDHMIQMKPQLIIFDLGNNSIPWTEWIPLLKNHPGMFKSQLFALVLMLILKILEKRGKLVQMKFLPDLDL